MTNLDVAFYYLLGDEGRKYTNDPNDKGGPTRYGITKKTYEEFFGKLVDDSEIEDMTEDVAKKIYATNYWHKLGCDRLLSLPIAIALFDTGVLYGVNRAAKLAQRALSFCGAPIRIDGQIGDQSVQHLNQVKDPLFIRTFREQILQRINEVIEEVPSDEEYRHGWTNRADRLLTLLDDGTINNLKAKAAA